MDPSKPSPLNMRPRARPEIAAAPPATRSRYVRATDIPRCGLPGVAVWPDTGVLLGLGVEEALPARFRRRFGDRTWVPRAVEQELRSHSDGFGLLADAATRVVRAWFLGDRKARSLELTNADQAQFDRVRVALKGLSNEPGKKHGGESVAITLAARESRLSGVRQVLLVNDRDASIVAAQEGLSSRHIGDVIAELECADGALGGQASLELFAKCCAISRPPRHACQANAAEFTCGRHSGVCATCDK
jgi:hypothetical protein